MLAGQQIAEVGDFPNSSEDHLHFEIRLPFDSSSPGGATSVPVDPTAVLYGWEEKTYRNDAQAREGHVLDGVVITSIEEVRRASLLRFFLVNVAGDSRDLLVPLHHATEYERHLVGSLEHAFHNSSKVRIVWRESLFYRGIQDDPAGASVIAEVKVYR